jgi:hypothetical protein
MNDTTCEAAWNVGDCIIPPVGRTVKHLSAPPIRHRGRQSAIQPSHPPTTPVATTASAPVGTTITIRSFASSSMLVSPPPSAPLLARRSRQPGLDRHRHRNRRRRGGVGIIHRPDPLARRSLEWHRPHPLVAESSCRPKKKPQAHAWGSVLTQNCPQKSGRFAP